MMSHEILLKHKIDLKKFLKEIRVYKQNIIKAPKTFGKLMNLINKKYPDVKVIIL